MVLTTKGYKGDGITNGLKQRRISDWKAQGVICKINQTYEDLHNEYVNAIKCVACDVVFEKGRGTKTGQTKIGKCLDHNHTTGYMRQIICRSCNTSDRFESLYAYKFLIDINQF